MRFKRQGGFIGYVLAIISLLSMVAFTAAKLSRTGSQQQWRYESVATVLDQASLIRNRLLACGVGNRGAANGTSFRPRFPAGATPVAVTALACPGTPPQNIWTGVGGTTLPAPPRGYAPWQYANDAASLRIFITPTAGVTDPATVGVLDAVVARLPSTATRSASTGTLTIVVMN